MFLNFSVRFEGRVLDEKTLPLSIDFLKQKERLKTNRESCRKQNKSRLLGEGVGSQLPVQELSVRRVEYRLQWKHL